MNCTPFYSRTLLYLLSVTLIAPPILINLAPQADARAGRGFSMGSRGSRTYSAPTMTRSAPSGGQSFQRSMTRPPTATPSTNPGSTNNFNTNPMSNRPAPVTAAPAAGGGFMRGLMGGVVGAAAYNMFFGHKPSQAQDTNGQNQNGQGAEQGQNQAQHQPEQKSGGMGSFFRIAILGLIIWYGIRFFRKRREAAKNANNAQNSTAAAPPSHNPISEYINQTNIQLNQNDYTVFQQRLVEVQDAWNKQDLGGLQKITTPEMLSYFNEQLTDLNNRGLHNTTSNVQFQQGDLSEAWTEGTREYATVSMVYSLIDVTTDSTGHVVEGDQNQPVTITELWTFVRDTNAGLWFLSGIQQKN